MNETLERRIATTLKSDDIASADLANLLTEVEAALAQASKAVTIAEAHALDLDADPGEAASALKVEQIKRDRLLGVMPRLDAKYHEAHAAEEYGKWRKRFDTFRPKHASAIGQIKDAYLLFEDVMLSALIFAREVDQEGHRIMQDKPDHLPQSNGDGCFLETVERAARGGNYQSLMTELKIPHFDAPGFAWPALAGNDWAINYVNSLSASGAFAAPDANPDWQSFQLAKKEAALAENAKMVAYHKGQAQAQEERIKKEAAAERAARLAKMGVSQ